MKSEDNKQKIIKYEGYNLFRKMLESSCPGVIVEGSEDDIDYKFIFQQNKPFDFKPFLAKCFAMNKKCWSVIDKYYNDNEIACHDNAKNSEWYNHPYLSCDFEYELYSKKVLGILLCYDIEILYKLCKSGWIDLINRMESIKVVDINRCLLQTYRFKENGYIKNIQQNNNRILAIWYCEQKGLETINKEEIWLFLDMLRDVYVNHIDFEKLYKHRLKYEKRIDMYFNVLMNEGFIFKSLNQMMCLINTDVVNHINLRNNALLNGFYFEDDYPISEEMYKKSIFDYMFIYEKFDVPIDIKELKIFIIINIYNNLVVEEYKKIKDYSFRNANTQLLFELGSLKNSYQVLLEENKKQEKIYEFHLQNLKYDAAVFFINTISHSMYYKYINLVRNNNGVKYGFVHSQNINIIESQIANILDEK